MKQTIIQNRTYLVWVDSNQIQNLFVVPEIAWEAAVSVEVWSVYFKDNHW